MYYYVIKQPTRYHQMTLDEFLSMDYIAKEYNTSDSSTRVYTSECFSEKVLKSRDIPFLIARIEKFNEIYADLFKKNKKDLYHTFYIPKKNGGNRRIDAPNDELMEALRVLKGILEYDFNALYHTSAFAYIKKRSTIDSVKRHQQNESKWFLKLDLHDFFGSTTLEFVMEMFEKIFPFSEICKNPDSKRELKKALSLGFLNGGLPQGTPLSPLITNIMMIPIDYALSNACRKEKGNLVYTRYADDFLITSRFNFRFKDVQQMVIKTLKDFNAPFMLNTKKTRYGSINGSNWNLGVMLNKDNQITIGYKNKKRFEAMLFNFVMDHKNSKPWDISEVQHLCGLKSYYKMVEGDTIDRIIEHMNKKLNADINKMLKMAIGGTL